MASSNSELPPATEGQVLSVSALTAIVKELLETALPTLWVAGEISNFSRPQSGHCYFTLKDDQAQIRAVMWRNAAQRAQFALEDGLQVICRGNLDVYAPRGTYQFVVDAIQPQGIGALELALRKLREKLEGEGLFDPRRKRPLPQFPRRVAFVTSPTGAAIHDFLEVLNRRWRGLEVLVIPSRVQGDGAAQEIAAGIGLVNRLNVDIDVLVVGRGGGSLEDLWAFNEEPVVRAIAASRIPVISAVGHEIDVTLADLVADVRALTPSEAAERVAPSTEDVMGIVRGYQQRMAGALRTRLGQAETRLRTLAASRVMRRPYDRIHDLERRLDEWTARASRSIDRRLSTARNQVDRLAGKLDSLSPLAVLGRGYSLTQRLEDGRLLTDAQQISPGESIITRLAHGQIVSRVEEIRSDADPFR